MQRIKQLALFGLGALLLTAPAAAEGDAAEMDPVKEVIVVTASRTEQQIHEVPAAITVIGADQIESLPADDYGDLLRNVPGLNVSQMSARDVNVTGRGATNSLAASQLVLLDGRTLYLDFFGFVMWDFVPLDPKEIKQIEVVRGPGSAVWGANAMSGVINLITKAPKEMQGTSITLGAGELGTSYGSVTHAGVSGKLGYKVSAAYFNQDDPYERPTGIIPGSVGPTNPTGTPYPPFENLGTAQPKFNLRFDYDQAVDSTVTFAAGLAETDGIIHTGIGPFDISTGSAMNFLKFDWNKRAQRVGFFVNFLDGDANNLLTVGPDGKPLAFAFQSETYDLSYTDTRVGGQRHIFTYGANARKNNFDLSIAPAGDSREEYGFFAQDEILLGDKVRWLIGGRWDDIDPIGSVTSPRTSLLFSPGPNHTFRVSFNRAFKAPSMINNYLDIVIVNAAVLPAVPPLLPNPYLLIFPSQAVGNPGLTEEQLDAYEIGYVGTYGDTTFTLSVYRNETTKSIDFFTSAYYSSLNPPPGWPLPPFIPTPIGLIGTVPDDTFPAQFSYRNIGEIIDQGVELSLQGRAARSWSWFFNYSYQDTPEVSGIAQVRLPNGNLVDGVNQPPQSRVNAGISYDGERFFVNTNANYQDDAFWTDVLDSRFYGPTDSFTMVNVGAGIHFSGDRATLSVNAQNVFDEEVLQHVFGDIIGRKVTGQITFRF